MQTHPEVYCLSRVVFSFGGIKSANERIQDTGAPKTDRLLLRLVVAIRSSRCTLSLPLLYVSIHSLISLSRLRDGVDRMYIYMYIYNRRMRGREREDTHTYSHEGVGAPVPDLGCKYIVFYAGLGIFRHMRATPERA